jgi:hypothetical protein
VSLIAGALGGDQDGAARLVIAGGDVESVEMMTDGAVENSLRHQIHGVVSGIDNRCSDDAFLVETVRRAAGQCLVADLGGGDSLSRIGEVDPPELGAGVGIDRIDRIRLGDDVDDVVGALAGNVHVRHVEGLGHHDIVDRKAEEVTEAVLADVGGGEQSLIGVGVAAAVIATAGSKGQLRERRRQKSNADDEQNQAKITGRRRTGCRAEHPIINGPGRHTGTDFHKVVRQVL